MLSYSNYVLLGNKKYAHGGTVSTSLQCMHSAKLKHEALLQMTHLPLTEKVYLRFLLAMRRFCGSHSFQNQRVSTTL